MSEGWPIHTLVFDLDDTLYAEREFALSGFRAVGEWMQKTHRVLGFASEATSLFEKGVRGKIFDEALRRMGRPARDDLIADLVRIYRSHLPRIALFPDAAECLAWAMGRFRLALVTDGYHEVQWRKIEALRIEPYFPCCVLTDALGREAWKPSALGFRRVATHFPGRADGYVYVGDNPRKDFIGPRSLGWRTLRIRRAGGEHATYEPAPGEAADLEIHSLRELAMLAR